MTTRPPKSIKASTALQFVQLQKAISTKEKITYKLQGKYTFQGLPIDVENKAGSIRRSEPGQTPKWETKMGYDYGYIRNTEAKDKEAVDVYVNLKSKGEKEDYHTGEVVDTDIYVVHQKQIWKSKNWHNGICPTCKKHHTECNHAYDEDKVMLGFESKEAAIKAYLEQYDSRMFLGPVSTYTLVEFKTALKNSWGKKLPHKKSKYEHWTGVDLDGTIAKDEGFKGLDYIGEPIKKMVDRINSLLKQGKKVKIMTARASDKKAIPHIKEWMKNNNIPLLEITNKKDPGMINLFDDRVTRVNKNSGNLAKSMGEYYADIDEFIVFGKSCGDKNYSVKKSYLGAQGDLAGSFPMMKENIGQRSYSVDKTPRTISEALDDIEKSFEANKMDGEDLDDYTRRYMRELHGKNVSSMLDVDNGYGDMDKAFVKASTYVNKQGKTVHRQAYVDKRKKKITHVKHSKMTRMDLTSKDAQKKIDEVEKKKKHHNLHIEAAEKEKKSAEYNKEIGNTQYAIGDKLHDIDSVIKHLDDHIDHHTNEAKSHDNHIKKIKERHETEAKHWKKKREESKTKEKTKADHINDLLKDGEHKGKKLDKDTVTALKKMKGEEKNKATFSTQKEYSEWYRKQLKDIKEEHKLNRVGGKFVATWGDYGAIEPVIVRKAGKKETEYTIPKKAVVAKKERTEAEKTKSKSDDMKGNKNAFKGGPKDEPEKKAREPKNISVSKGKAASPVEPSSKEPEKIVVSDERRIDYSGKKVEGVPPHLEKEPEIKVEKPKKDYYPKVTEKDGNIHFDFSEEPKGEISIPEFKSTGFTKLTKKDIETGAKGTPLESAVTLAKSFGEKLAETEKSKHEKREESMRKFAKERDREHIGHHFISPKVDIGYQIVDGDVYLRVNIGRPKRTYYKDSPLPDKIPTKKTAIIIDPSGKSIEAGRSWRDEIEVQKKVYTANSKLSSEDYSIIETLQKSSYHTRHRFFQNAEYDLETNTIKAEASTKRLAGDPDTKISANLTVPRYLHLLAHYNSKQSGRFMGSGYVVPEKNLPVSVKDQIAIFREDNKAYGERISSTYYESYLKGLETSFGEKNSKDTLKADYGVKIKRQNGKEMTDDEVESLKVVIDHTYNSMGNPRVLRKFAEENNLKISFSGDKRAFLTKAVGLYVPNESTVVVGDTMREVLPHEMTHFVDDVLGGKMGAEGKGRGYYASEMQNTDIGRMTAEGRQTFSKDKRTSGAYWSRSCEVFARMVEQYSAINDGNKGYYTMPGYWNEGAFKKLEPKIVAVLKANLGKSFGEFFPQKPYSVKKAV